MNSSTDYPETCLPEYLAKIVLNFRELLDIKPGVVFHLLASLVHLAGPVLDMWGGTGEITYLTT